MSLAYGASASIACTLASLGSSATWVAGRSSAEVDNTTTLGMDRVVSAKITVGTSPTTGTQIEMWLIPKLDDGNYPDVFDGTDKAVTVTSRGVLTSYGILLGLISLDAGTSNVAYFLKSTVSAKHGIAPPKKFQLFFTHNTGVNLNATGGNHSVTEIPVTL